MCAHTPGPWKAQRRRDGFQIVDGDGYRQIVFVGADEITEAGGERMTREQEANARLIAAAPELLATMREVLSDVERGLSGSQLRSAMLAMRAAIAKAEGKPA